MKDDVNVTSPAPQKHMAVAKKLEWHAYPEDGSRVSEGQNAQRNYVSRAQLPWPGAFFVMEKDGRFSLENYPAMSFENEHGARHAAQSIFNAWILAALATEAAGANLYKLRDRPDAVLTPSPQTNMTVRRLEWDEEELPAAQCVFGHYVINPWYHHVELLIGYGKMVMTSLGRIELGKDCSIDDLKAAAQTDYEKRILSALDATPQVNLPDFDKIADAIYDEMRVSDGVERAAAERYARAALAALAVPPKVKLRDLLEEALAVLDGYADPTGYTDNYGEQLPADAVQHQGLLAKATAEKIRAALATTEGSDR